MKYKLLGASGLRVSEIALGTLNFGESKAWGVAEADALAILGAFVERGGTLIDTAPNYAGGAAERIVGAFAQRGRERVLISTKYTASGDPHVLAGGNSARTMIRSVEESLGRLQTDYIDVLWLHFWDGTTPLAEILRGFNHLAAAGKVRYFGFSDIPAWLVSRAVTMAELRGWAPPIAVQVEYSLAARDVEREFLPMADALDLGVVGWGAMAAGALGGAAAPARRPKDKIPKAVRAAVEQVERIAGECGVSSRALALRWLLGGSPTERLVPLIGARSVDQLVETLDAAEGDLAPEIVEALSRATAPRLGFPHDLIGSPYLRRFAIGEGNSLMPPPTPRA